jgi:hypothetical protein
MVDTSLPITSKTEQSYTRFAELQQENYAVASDRSADDLTRREASPEGNRNRTEAG